MIIGIVGSEAAKFTAVGEARAKAYLKALISHPKVTGVASGHCHLGGIDIWAIEIGRDLGKHAIEFPPAVLNWTDGYKPRNLKIAMACQVAVCVTVDVLPPDYTGMRFPLCYHCARARRDAKSHVKSGGCWTVIEAMKLGKRGMWKIIENERREAPARRG